jgi:trimeric autotransporter adhesin
MGMWTEAVQKLYIAYFNRPADALGLILWEDQAAQAGNTTAISNVFSTSSEFTTLYAGKTSEQIVDTIYMNLFARHAESAAIPFWASKLNSGELTLGSIVTTIMNSAQGTDASAVTNKVWAATNWTTSCDTSAEIVGYSGYAANAVARAWLSNVSHEAQTLMNALITMDANIAAAVAAHDQSGFTADSTFAAEAYAEGSYVDDHAVIIGVKTASADGHDLFVS